MCIRDRSSDGVYYYVCNRDGELLYHPRRAEIDRELFKENSLKAAGYEDGVLSLIHILVNWFKEN